MSDNDQAAVEALLKVRCPPISKAYSHGDLAIPYKEGAEAIIAAIRKGEVSGVCMEDPLVALRGAILALEWSEKDRADKAMAALTTSGEMYKAKCAEVDKATAERDRLAGLLIESNRLLKDAKRHLGPHTTNSDADTAIARNDAALAEVGKS